MAAVPNALTNVSPDMSTAPGLAAPTVARGERSSCFWGDPPLD